MSEYNFVAIAKHYGQLYEEYLDHTVRLSRHLFPPFTNYSSDNSRILTEAMVHIAWSFIDLCIAIKHMALTSEEKKYYETRYFLRVIVVHCHDILSADSSGTLAKINLVKRHFMTDIEVAEVLRLLKAESKELKKIQTENRAYLGNIRNRIFAHRDGSSLQQTEILEELDGSKIFEIADKIQETNKVLLGLLASISPIINNNDSDLDIDFDELWRISKSLVPSEFLRSYGGGL